MKESKEKVRNHGDKSLFPFGIFLLVFFTNLLLPISPISDTVWNIPTGMSLLLSGDFNLDEYSDLKKEYNHYGISESKGHSYNYFPPGVSILAIPQLFVLTQINGSREILNHSAEAGRFVAAGWMAVAALFLFYAFRRKFGEEFAIGFSLLFAFCTPALSTGGRALWQQSGVLLLNSALFWILTKDFLKRAELLWIGAICGFAIWVRPTTVITSICIFLYLLKTIRIRAFTILIPAVSFLILFLIFNWNLFDSPLPTYYGEHSHRISSFGMFLHGFLGNLFSPSRGLIIWSPFLILSFYGFYRSFRKKESLSSISTLFAFIVLFHLCIISGYNMWWGGHSIGPRFWTEMIPFFLWFCAKGFRDLNLLNEKVLLFRRIWIFLCVLSFAIHLRASVDAGPTLWNRYPVDVDQDPSRIWDWKDPQFLRGDHGVRFFL
ncbi:dolichyl-phosphate-mannose--protein mannosyltransferase [Leptospira sp. WS92.C1]